MAVEEIIAARAPAEVVGSICSLIKYVRAIFQRRGRPEGHRRDIMDTFQVMIDRADAFKAKHGQDATKGYIERYDIPVKG